MVVKDEGSGEVLVGGAARTGNLVQGGLAGLALALDEGGDVDAGRGGGQGELDDELVALRVAAQDRGVPPANELGTAGLGQGPGRDLGGA